jgi:DNA-binding LacI/PurR family transcriptional regulator
MKNAISAVQIARMAGVSPATVSRALNPEQAWRISREKRQEIRSLASKYGFKSRSARKAGRYVKTFRVAFLLGRMQHDLVSGGNVLVHKMCDILQSNGYILELIRVDFSPENLVANVRNMLKSGEADVYVIGGGLMRGQSLELLRKLSSRLILLLNPGMQMPFPDFHWLSYFGRDAQDSYRQALATIPEKYLGKIVYFGNDNSSSHIKIAEIKRIAAAMGRDLSNLPECLFGDGSLIYPEDAYRTAHLFLQEHFEELEKYHTFFCSGRSAGALYDELVRHGRVPGKNFAIYSMGATSQLLPPLQKGINWLCRNLDREAEMLCEQILLLVDDPTPQRKYFKWSFIPADYGDAGENHSRLIV